MCEAQNLFSALDLLNSVLRPTRESQSVYYACLVLFIISEFLLNRFYGLANIFTFNGYPSESNPYLFNGVFVDMY